MELVELNLARDAFHGEWSVLEALEAILRKGQGTGEFRAFDLRVMAITIRQAIDVVPRLLAANPNPDVEAYARTGDPV